MRKALDLIGALLCLVAWATAVLAEPIKVTVGITALSGMSATLAFDLIDGGSPGSTVVLSSFTTDGTLGGSSTSGGASGSFPGSVTLPDTAFFSEYLQSITLGTSFSFVFDTTGGAADPGSFPDAFSLFILDAVATASLVATSDPTGANAILLYSIGEAGPLAVYAANGLTVTVESVNSVPEPGALLLALTACGLVLLRHLGKSRSFVPAARQPMRLRSRTAHSAAPRTSSRARRPRA